SLFRAIDRTLTGAGGRLLAERLTSPLTDPAMIGERLDSVAFFRDETNLANTLAHCLKRAPDMPRALSRLALNRGGPRDLAALCAGLSVAAEVAGLLPAELPAELGRARAALAVLPEALRVHLDNALGDEPPLLKRDGGFVRAGY